MDQIFKSYDENILDRINLDLLAAIALRLIEQHGMVAGRLRADEDSAGRAALELVPEEDTVNRAFKLAGLFVERATAEGRIKDLGPLHERKIALQSYDAYRIVSVKDKSFEDEVRSERRTEAEKK